MGLLKQLLRAISYGLEPSPERKGELGEARLKQEVQRIFRRDTYYFFHDLTIPDYDGTTQVDHVLVTYFGVFVIETKNYKGWIFGSAEQRTWTQTFRTSKHRLQNPLRQNYNHVKAVQTLTNLRTDAVHSLVVFVGDAEFKTAMPYNVVTLWGLRSYFRTFSEPLLTHTEMQAIVGRIEGGRLAPGAETNLRHREHLRQVQANPVCPRCGKSMVLRIAKKGVGAGREFWGCSGFPKCRATKPK